MSQISYDEVNLMLRLYDLRREPRLREARAWFVDHFHAGTPEELMQKYPQGSQENTYIRMVISYWEMVAGIVNRGLINDELFFESNGELWVVWDRMRTIVPTWRAAFKNPTLFSGIEEACKRLEAWRERRAPGSSVAMRQGEVTPSCPRNYPSKMWLTTSAPAFPLSVLQQVSRYRRAAPLARSCAPRPSRHRAPYRPDA